MTSTGPFPFATPVLFDETSRPDFRTVYGTLCASSTHLDVALTRLRLSALDLTREELRRVRRVRLVLAEVNAVTLDVEAHAVLTGDRRSDTLRELDRRLREGTVEIRAAPLAGWSPDFSVFSEDGAARAVMLGFHWFQRPFPHRGPAWCSLHGAEPATRCHTRFDGLWGRAHDIGRAVLGILERAEKPLGDKGFPGDADATRRLDTHPALG